MNETKLRQLPVAGAVRQLKTLGTGLKRRLAVALLCVLPTFGLHAELPVDSLPGVSPRPERAPADRGGRPPNPEPRRPEAWADIQQNFQLVPAPPLRQDRLTLRNADWLEGRLGGVDGKTLEWTSNITPESIRFRREGIALVSFRPPAKAVAVEPGKWVVHLVDGDVLQGNDLTLDGEQLVLRANHLGSVQVPRAVVRSVHHDTAPKRSRIPAVHSVVDWERMIPGQGTNAELRVYRNLDLPEAFQIEFELAPRDQRRLQLHLPLSSPRLDGEEHVVVLSEGNRIVLQASRFLRPAVMRNPDDLPGILSGRSRVTVIVSQPQGRALLLVDGREVATANFSRRDARATGMAILHGVTPEAEPELRTLVVSHAGVKLEPPPLAPDADWVRLANGDTVPGRLVSIEPTQAVVVGGLGRIEVPLPRLAGVNFFAGDAGEALRQEDEVRVHLSDATQVTGQLKALGVEAVILNSAVLGERELDRASVRSVQFGLSLPCAARLVYPNSAAAANALFEPGKIRLLPNVSLAGDLVGWSNGVVRWQHPFALAPISVAQSNVLVVNPVVEPGGGTEVLPASTVELTHSEHFQAELLGLDRDSLSVRTSFGALWKVDRRRVRAVYPNRPTDVLDAGPNAQWEVVTPQFPSRLRLGPVRQYTRQMTLPDRLCLQLELVGLPVAWTFGGSIFDSLELGRTESRRPSYRLNFGNALTLSDLGAGDQYRVSSSVCLPGLSSTGRARVTWLADRKAGQEFLLVDGRLVNQRTGIRLRVPGNGIQFNTQQVEIRKVILQEWKGNAETVAAPTAEGDSVRLHDWTTVAGKIESIREGQVWLATGQAVPLGQVAELRLERSSRETAMPASAQARVSLTDGGQLMLTEVAVDSGEFRGRLPGAGDVRLPRGSVRRLQYEAAATPGWVKLIETRTFAERTQYCYKCHR